MKNRIAVGLASAGLLLNPQFSHGRLLGQASWDRYTPRSFAQVDAAVRPGLLRDYQANPGFTMSLTNVEYASRTRVRYLDSTRTLTPENRGMIEVWVKARGADPRALTAFQHEILVAEDTLQLWIPVQEVLLSAFRSELRPGDLVTLFNVYVGAYGEGETVTLVFLVNEFLKE